MVRELETPCIVMTHPIAATGYGMRKFHGKWMLAHRVAFFEANGHWPNICRHRCDNRPCVNPEHLEDGTRADNVRDMMERGGHRRTSTPGERCGKSKLNDEAVKCTRWLAAHGTSHKRIARAHGIVPSNVTSIVKRRTWKHLPEQDYERNPQ
jgi:hypothetical protein